MTSFTPTLTPIAEALKHSRLGASKADRWLNCTGSIQLEKLAPPARSSSFADEGSAAHSVSYHLAAGLISLIDLESDTWAYHKQTDRLALLKTLVSEGINENDLVIIDDEMESGAVEWCDYINSIVHNNPGAKVFLEVRLDYSEFVPGGFGTADCVIVCGDTIYVLDYKYGRGVKVYAMRNPQALLYALGAYLEMSYLYDIKKISLHIVQPRISHFDEWETDLEFLIEFAETARTAAIEALDESQPPKLNPGEKQCKFCPASGICPAQAELAMRQAGQDFTDLDQLLETTESGAVVFTEPELLTPARLAQLMPSMDYIEQWAKDVKARVHDSLMAGVHVPGYKLVLGRSQRKWNGTDTEVAHALTGLGVSTDSLYTRKLVSPAQAEKLVGKKNAPALASLVLKAPGSPSVAEVEDKRPEYKPLEAAQASALTDFTDFGGTDPLSW
jgi:hypothetical protein